MLFLLFLCSFTFPVNFYVFLSIGLLGMKLEMPRYMELYFRIFFFFMTAFLRKWN
ncbi:hypothetical protein GLOIN_2v1504252 [Rhizophagus irregularis DAOM 181602=DAOM 197198]|uniref:Uncharacterized protein n=1 Tax=Rhizophagus irregularis (strain DAOM 181602 / DAOM 197198 / MUCL 43194) TaxID=747089 RepID=A0A2P4QVK8_RHIID|nr:hypothetical protein GLOIN_2v1504252 [Rhizophagus irregularis DAOM 181602=DAOM 197198]POG81665.1 hypothetical protein GLOIN_2v1504252 [Rhizophagus irregularis DAOM 181602=DAOM 197198]|eukprot:XP_025188531.1 hypothetical protein GLOIN_2v1504252 [Rhizophagus irregularis DAOM 181602=DAOM 197198]